MAFYHEATKLTTLSEKLTKIIKKLEKFSGGQSLHIEMLVTFEPNQYIPIVSYLGRRGALGDTVYVIKIKKFNKQLKKLTVLFEKKVFYDVMTHYNRIEYDEAKDTWSVIIKPKARSCFDYFSENEK